MHLYYSSKNHEHYYLISRSIKAIAIFIIYSSLCSITPIVQGRPNHNRLNPLQSSSQNYYQIDDDDYDRDNNNDNNDNSAQGNSFMGLGREFPLFDNRGGDTTSSPSSSFPNTNRVSTTTTSPSTTPQWPSRATNYYNRKRRNSRSNYYNKSASTSSSNRSILSSIKEWISNGNLPKIQCRVEPNTTLKVRKTFRPLKTVVRLGADFNTQLGVWQFKSSWEDEVIGGKLTLAGREVQFSKTWLLSVGEFDEVQYCCTSLLL